MKRESELTEFQKCLINIKWIVNEMQPKKLIENDAARIIFKPSDCLKTPTLL